MLVQMMLDSTISFLGLQWLGELAHVKLAPDFALCVRIPYSQRLSTLSRLSCHNEKQGHMPCGVLDDLVAIHAFNSFAVFEDLCSILTRRHYPLSADPWRMDHESDLVFFTL